MLDIASSGLPAALSVPFGLVERAYRRLSSQVQHMSQEELEYRGPAGDLNSTAMLVAHLAYADLTYLHLIKGAPIPEAMDAEYGPFETEDGRLPVVTGHTAAELLARYQRVIDMAREYLSTQTDDDALRAVAIPWWPQTATVRYVLWHIAGHSMFHQGHIARLREWYRHEKGRPE